jgi:hypothetical protein
MSYMREQWRERKSIKKQLKIKRHKIQFYFLSKDVLNEGTMEGEEVNQETAQSIASQDSVLFFEQRCPE